MTEAGEPYGAAPGRLLRRICEEIEGLDPGAGIAAVREVLDEPSPLLDEFFRQCRDYRDRVFAGVERVRSVRIEDQTVKDRIGCLPVSFLGDRARHALPPPPGTKTQPARLVLLSPETAVKQLINHPCLSVVDYRKLPGLPERGHMEVLGSRHLAFFRFFDRYWHKAIVKQTSRNEIYLVSYHRIQTAQVPEEIRRTHTQSGG